MLRRQFSQVLLLAIAASALTNGRAAFGVNPNELQDAYWRFEEGVAEGFVPAAAPGNEGPGEIQDTVRDSSGNANHMQAFNTNTAPKYINSSLPPTSLASGAPNTLAWQVDGSSTGGRDVYTNNEKIQNGMVGGMFDPDGDGPNGIVANSVTGFTLEAAFSVFDYSSFRSIVAKEGRPGLEMATGDETFQALPTLALKVREPQGEGDPDQGKLQIELFDGAGNLVNVSSDDPMALGQWYYAAVVNDGQTLSLYLDSNDGNGYVLEGQTAVDGALFQGEDYNDADWNYNWTIGRATFGGFEDDGVTPHKGGRPSDWFNGLIDEVRLTNEALDPSDFLFAQEAPDGDYTGDGLVNGADFLAWQRGTSTNGLTAGDLQAWKDTFGSATVAGSPAPEPATLSLVGLAIGAGLMVRRRYN